MLVKNRQFKLIVCLLLLQFQAVAVGPCFIPDAKLTDQLSPSLGLKQERVRDVFSSSSRAVEKITGQLWIQEISTEYGTKLDYSPSFKEKEIKELLDWIMEKYENLRPYIVDIYNIVGRHREKKIRTYMEETLLGHVHEIKKQIECVWFLWHFIKQHDVKNHRLNSISRTSDRRGLKVGYQGNDGKIIYEAYYLPPYLNLRSDENIQPDEKLNIVLERLGIGILSLPTMLTNLDLLIEDNLRNDLALNRGGKKRLEELKEYVGRISVRLTDKIKDDNFDIKAEADDMGRVAATFAKNQLVDSSATLKEVSAALKKVSAAFASTHEGWLPRMLRDQCDKGKIEKIHVVLEPTLGGQWGLNESPIESIAEAIKMLTDKRCDPVIVEKGGNKNFAQMTRDLTKEMNNMRYRYKGLDKALEESLKERVIGGMANELYGIESLSRSQKDIIGVSIVVRNARGNVTELDQVTYDPKRQIATVWENKLILTDRVDEKHLFRIINGNTGKIKLFQREGGLILDAIRKYAEGKKVNAFEVCFTIDFEGVSAEKKKEYMAELIKQVSVQNDLALNVSFALMDFFGRINEHRFTTFVERLPINRVGEQKFREVDLVQSAI